MVSKERRSNMKRRDLWTEKYGSTPMPAPVKKAHKMNGTEREWAEILDYLKRSGEIIDWKYDPFNLRLADNTYYRPDFLVVYPGHFEIIEIKGGWMQDDSIAKFKIAAEQFPWFVFKMVQKKSKNSPFETVREA